MDYLSKISPNSYITIGFLIAFYLSNTLDVAEQNTLGNWFQLVGQTLETSASQTSLINSRSNPPSSMSLERLTEIIRNIEIELNKLKEE